MTHRPAAVRQSDNEVMRVLKQGAVTRRRATSLAKWAETYSPTIPMRCTYVNLRLGDLCLTRSPYVAGT